MSSLIKKDWKIVFSLIFEISNSLFLTSLFLTPSIKKKLINGFSTTVIIILLFAIEKLTVSKKPVW